MAKDLLDKTGLAYLATKFQEWCESLFVKKDTEYENVEATNNGVKVSLGGTIGEPTISVETTVGDVSENNSGIVGGDKVKAYVDANKGVSTVFSAQTSTSSAKNGLVPAPTIANSQKYLRGDGTWQTVGNREATAARMGYVILDPNKTFAGQVTAENTIYEIRDEFDLGGATKELPAGCVLRFEGGSLVNGTIHGTDTVLSGVCISVDKMSGSFQGGIKSSYSTLPEGYEKLKMLLSIKADILSLDQDFTLDGNVETMTTSIPVIQGNSTISVNGDIDGWLITATNTSQIAGLSFDHNGNQANGSINITAGAYMTLTNLKSTNIQSVGSSSGCYVFNVSTAYDCSVDGLEVSNISAIGNGTIGDNEGAVVGLFIAVSSNDSHIEINNVSFNDIFSTINNVPVLEDATGVYVACSDRVNNNSTLHISFIRGVNYGKRLIKTDMNNIFIEKVNAIQNYKNLGLTVIGLNNHDSSESSTAMMKNVVIRDVRFKGSSRYIVENYINDVFIENVNAEFYPGTLGSGTDTTFFCLFRKGRYSHNMNADNISVINGALFANDNQSGETDELSILSNVSILFDGKSNASLFNMTNGNVKLCNVTYTADSAAFLNYSLNIGHIVFDGFFAKNNAPENSFTYLFQCSSSETNCNVQLYNFDIETRRGLFGLYGVKTFILQNGIIRSKLVHSSTTIPYGNIYTSEGAQFRIKNTDVVSYSAGVGNDLYVTHPSGVNPLYLDIDGSVTSAYVQNSYWVNTTLTMASGSSPSLQKGLTRKYTVSGHGYVVVRYEDNGYSIVSPPKMTKDFAEAISNSTTIELEIGVSVFDTTSGKNIWWNGSAWVDALGLPAVNEYAEVRHTVNGIEIKVISTDVESQGLNIYAPTELGSDDYIVVQQNDKAAFVDPVDIGLK